MTVLGVLNALQVDTVFHSPAAAAWCLSATAALNSAERALDDADLQNRAVCAWAWAGAER